MIDLQILLAYLALGCMWMAWKADSEAGWADVTDIHYEIWFAVGFGVITWLGWEIMDACRRRRS